MVGTPRLGSEPGPHIPFPVAEDNPVNQRLLAPILEKRGHSVALVFNGREGVAITANAMKGDRERCLAGGMDGYLAKPIHQQEVFGVIENMPIIKEIDTTISFDGSLFEGDPDFLAEIVNLFLETYPGLLSEIESAVSNKDGAALGRAAHTMKGAVANFGAKAVVDQAKALEMMGKNGDLAPADDAAQSLRALMNKLVPELESALEKATEK